MKLNKYLNYMYDYYPPSYYNVAEYNDDYKVTLYDMSKLECERLNLLTHSDRFAFSTFVKNKKY